MKPRLCSAPASQHSMRCATPAPGQETWLRFLAWAVSAISEFSMRGKWAFAQLRLVAARTRNRSLENWGPTNTLTRILDRRQQPCKNSAEHELQLPPPRIPGQFRPWLTAWDRMAS